MKKLTNILWTFRICVMVIGLLYWILPTIYLGLVGLATLIAILILDIKLEKLIKKTTYSSIKEWLDERPEYLSGPFVTSFIDYKEVDDRHKESFKNLWEKFEQKIPDYHKDKTYNYKLRLLLDTYLEKYNEDR